MCLVPATFYGLVLWSEMVFAGEIPVLPRPKVYGDRLSKRVLDPRYRLVNKRIVLYHNFFRTRVDPPASDMLEMTWHSGAADDAQRWADSCQLLTHDNATGRWVDEYGSCGQNIFVSNVKVPWFFAIKIWFLEHHNFSFGDQRNNIPSRVGHYTQMVWYSSHKLGCGFQYCGRNVTKKPYYNYVCNYCPIGNYPERFGQPYTKGKPCAKCPGHCRSKRLCTNPCEHADFWVNCREIAQHWRHWLCSNPKAERYKACRATCGCHERIR
ncbi:cysteine-rich venom protein LEI1-like isoform X2 [Ornithodoros turicata]